MEKVKKEISIYKTEIEKINNIINFNLMRNKIECLEKSKNLNDNERMLLENEYKIKLTAPLAKLVSMVESDKNLTKIEKDEIKSKISRSISIVKFTFDIAEPGLEEQTTIFDISTIFIGAPIKVAANAKTVLALVKETPELAKVTFHGIKSNIMLKKNKEFEVLVRMYQRMLNMSYDDLANIYPKVAAYTDKVFKGVINSKNDANFEKLCEMVIKGGNPEVISKFFKTRLESLHFTLRNALTDFERILEKGDRVRISLIYAHIGLENTNMARLAKSIATENIKVIAAKRNPNDFELVTEMGEKVKRSIAKYDTVIIGDKTYKASLIINNETRIYEIIGESVRVW